MARFRIVIHDHLIEARRTQWGAEQVMLDGRVVSDKPFAGFLWSTRHEFNLTDAAGRNRLITVRFISTGARLGRRYAPLVAVDTVNRCLIEPESDQVRAGHCHNCGYNLTGLPETNEEVQCPECGRHIAAKLLYRRSE